MHEIAYVQVGVTDEGEPIMRRVMTAEQIVERADWNMAVTAESVRKRAHANAARDAAKGNGHGVTGVVDFGDAAAPSAAD